jgi:DNA end-binding protein Ku
VAPRANWKGHLRLGALSCPVALFTAASASERVAFTTLNRVTGHRVRREFVEAAGGAVVPREAQAKGYDLGDEDYVVLEQAEIDAAVPAPTKVLEVGTFIAAGAIDLVFLDQPYYLAPAGKAATAVFVLLRDALAAEGVGALARTVIFRRERLFFIVPYGKGLLAHTLRFDHEVRPAAQAFDALPELNIPAEMRELAAHIIETKRGHFDPREFDDRYEAALVAVIRAKQAGRPLRRAPAPPASGQVVDLLQALRRSAGQKAGGAAPRKAARGRKAGRGATAGRRPAPRRKAG